MRPQGHTLPVLEAIPSSPVREAWYSRSFMIVTAADSDDDDDDEVVP